jgi:predicted Zn-dependent protease
MDQSVERTQRTFIKIFFVVGVGFFAFVFLCWGGWHGYSLFESRHLTRRAEAYLGSHDLRSAMLSARRALQLNPENTAAIRLLGKIGEESGDKSALDWRRKAVELNPHSSEDLIALANAAVQFKDLPAAEKALQSVEENARDTADFHAASARIAEAKKAFPEAEREWSKAVEVARDNTSYQLQFALSLLRMDDPAQREKALSILQELRADEKQRAPATRALIASAVARRQNQPVLKMAEELKDYPEATLRDRLLYLDVLRQAQDPRFSNYLTSLEHEVASKPTDLAALLSWMNASGLSLLGIDYARSLPETERMKWPVNLALTEAYVKVADWPRMENAIKNQDWGAYEFLRHGYLALAARKQDKGGIADQEWLLAQKQAGSQTQNEWTLVRAATDWGWKKEVTDVLWSLADEQQSQGEALEKLYQRYYQASDTLGLYRVLGRLAQLRPEDSDIANNLAQVALLLNVDLARAQKTAAEIYKKQPDNPAYATTFAFSLYRQNNVGAALAVMSKLRDDAMKDPATAAYYAVFLADSGKIDKAREYMSRANAAKLLPEEKELLLSAERLVAREDH